MTAAEKHTRVASTNKTWPNTNTQIPLGRVAFMYVLGHFVDILFGRNKHSVHAQMCSSQYLLLLLALLWSTPNPEGNIWLRSLAGLVLKKQHRSTE